METNNDHQDKYPECTKITAHYNDLMSLRNFVQWLSEEKQYDIMCFDDIHKAIEPHEDLFAEFYGIDNKAAEIERQQMIEEIQQG